MDQHPEQPPEGKLIAEALKRKGVSIRQASRRAGISYGRWRQITSGYQNVSAGSFAAVRAPAATLARMARVVGVTPDAMEAAGRPDAAVILREDADQGTRPGAQIDLSALSPQEQRDLIGAARVLADLLARIEGAPGEDPGEERRGA